MTHPKESVDPHRIRLERIQRLKDLLHMADVEREKPGYRGGPKAAKLRDKFVHDWTRELKRLEGAA